MSESRVGRADIHIHTTLSDGAAAVVVASPRAAEKLSSKPLARVVAYSTSGVAPKDIDLRYENGELILQGKVASPARVGHLILGEFEDGDFYRVRFEMFSP